MDYDKLMKIINEADNDGCIIGFMFGSGYKFIYKNDEPFDRNDHIRKDLDCIVMHAKDCREREFEVYGVISDITHVYIAKDQSKPIDVTTSIMM